MNFSHYRRALGAILVYDITNEKTFENLKKLEESRIKNLEFSRIKTCGFFFGFAPLLEHSRISFWILNSKFRKLNLKKKQKQSKKF